MVKKYYKGLLIGGLLGGLFSFLGFLNEIHGPTKEFAQMINLDFRYFAFRPCLFLTQCHGESCMVCFLAGPIIAVLTGAAIGLLINLVIYRQKPNN